MSPKDYNPQIIEDKWKAYWNQSKLFKCPDNPPSEKFYCLVMFPYPSGTLHVGHGRNYIIGDVVARYKMMKGFTVLTPMGWDAFGLPAENAALKRGLHPKKSVRDNIDNMKRQLHLLGIGYDWDREIASCDPEYYRWTQWIFLKLYERGLAYRKNAPVNWCPSCNTALANEEVVNGGCERCGTEVVQKALYQWLFRITKYAQTLLDDLDTLENTWPKKVLLMQRNWIGRSEGARAVFTVESTGEELPIYTTRPDTLWGVTFMAIAPEHPLIDRLVKGTPYEEKVMEFCNRLRKRKRVVRGEEEPVKEGIFTGHYVINPVNGDRVPLWAASYALMDYGTGAVMAVPSHDQRDFEFAKKYDIPIKVVIQPPGKKLVVSEMTEAYVEEGEMVNSGPFDGTPNMEGIKKVTAFLKERGKGGPEVNYSIRDWLISRQRYWGAPIPIVYCDKCGEAPIPEKDLPVELPDEVDFTPRGQSPLAFVESFVNTTCPKCGGPAKRETDTICQWLCSCWYFLRFIDPKNDREAFSRALIDKWMPVDQYIGGVEHAVLHLLYTRFVVKVLCDAGYVSQKHREPFASLFTQGMICKRTYACTKCGHIVSDSPTVHEPCRCDYGMSLNDRIEKRLDVTDTLDKMSKSKGNVVSPNELCEKFGTDTLRLYELFIGPPQYDAEWSDKDIKGAERFLLRFWNAVTEDLERLSGCAGDYETLSARLLEAFRGGELKGETKHVFQETHRTIARVTGDIESSWQFNTAIAAVMELLNTLRATKMGDGDSGCKVKRYAFESMTLLLAPFVPHICEEIWEMLGHAPSIFKHGWPKANEAALKRDEIEMPVQVSGKVRGRITVAADATEDEVRAAVQGNESVAKSLEGKTIVKMVIVPGKIVNIVAK
ncbi:MAG TPA: leucine--tRNA ligase [Candidatus Brocadiia bacterium]|nr:leucine--tRNA ligase [Candidatus Brocadiia bacterium]